MNAIDSAHYSLHIRYRLLMLFIYVLSRLTFLRYARGRDALESLGKMCICSVGRLALFHDLGSRE